ncbi:6,7-dimethyl-8-ribityllumazine synthase [Nitrospinae bacterium AH_259_B05_G02_I21]|jgi:6,7-dimethyl-8-ribityllumazine synthase|nr:6,7-dimethyl-8-ribityllumazine synthase [Nitrospinae bacterium AH_259_B05_G02_I21]MDA2931549.1 6,7-dimethyl-8-ribityllumazine synthase [Nitrospinae bacterium AH-259-F20]MDV2495646.1 6,7-dimethyl-8-ribityllumazine synthase [bacterium]MDV2503233.1 6,7-dimethyl-8-ribityllumazine synthase [bacterium]
MPRFIEGALKGDGKKIAIVVSRFNEFVTTRLLDGAVDGLTRTGVADEDITVVRVPGAFEIPLAAKRLATSGTYQAVVCLGAVIRGETPHFEYISAEAARGIAQASLESNVPVIFGVITTETVEQAMERSGTKDGNRGFEAALAAVEMASLNDEL